MNECQPISVNNVLPKQGEGEEGGLGTPKKGSSHLPSREGEFERKIHFIDRTGLPRAGLVYLELSRNK